MNPKTRMEWWDGQTGSAMIAEYLRGHWHAWRREWGSSRWEHVDLTPGIKDQILNVLSSSESLL